MTAGVSGSTGLEVDVGPEGSEEVFVEGLSLKYPVIAAPPITSTRKDRSKILPLLHLDTAATARPARKAAGLVDVVTLLRDETFAVAVDCR